MTKSVTVVTINYNQGDQLKETLESVCRQTTKDYELIVVDGGSTDTSLKVLEDMDASIDHWVSEPDGGIYDAMNKGVAMSSGKYVNFMNSGDNFYSPTVLEEVSKLVQDGAPRLFHGRAYARESGKIYHYNPELWMGMVCSHQATFAERALLERFPFSTDFKIVSDYNFYVQCELHGAAVQAVDLDVALIDTSGVSFVGVGARTEERMRICRTAYPRTEVYEHFKNIFKQNGLDLPEWARTEADWLNGKA